MRSEIVDGMSEFLRQRPANRAWLCRLEADPGPCDAYIRSYYFDRNLGQCVYFVYGGCQGNPNRFTTRKECERACIID
ncbi:unnamed protein product, partial [Mesorhabditis belari]|uniref:BPTI/Kunitz inhibitor domain-containing protein n=1 Tax=Mesorhabditis belari TaxID=2138241 RepID=A0AAF3EG21_9BILA